MLGSDMLYAPGNLTRYEPEGVAEPEPYGRNMRHSSQRAGARATYGNLQLCALGVELRLVSGVDGEELSAMSVKDSSLIADCRFDCCTSWRMKYSPGAREAGMVEVQLRECS